MKESGSEINSLEILTQEVQSSNFIFDDDLGSIFDELYIRFKNFSKKLKKLMKELKSVKSENEKLLSDKVETIFSRASQAKFNDLKEKKKHARDLFAYASEC